MLDLPHLTSEVEKGCGTIVITEEVVRDMVAFRQLLDVLRREPEWSDLPVIALMSPRGTRELLARYESELHSVNLSVIERPARSETIGRAVLSALRARRRQYQVRDFLADHLRTQENLWRTQKLESIGVLAGGIAHDFNNLLTGIIGNASLLNYHVGEEQPSATYLREVLQSAERAAELTQQLLAYSGQGKFTVDQVDLSLLIKETTQLIRISIPATVQLHLDLADHLPTVSGDRIQIQQIVMNLIINAAESIPAGHTGEVWVATSARHFGAGELQTFASKETLSAGHYVCFEVEDNGSGMSSETAAKIFDPFFTTKFTGRGLGLAAVHGIVGGHKGGLSVTTQLGKGTRFLVLLPKSDKAGVAPSAEGRTVDLGKGRILLVDDETLILKLGAAVLRRLGYEVLLAENGKQAIEALATHADVDLVILDLTMPVMSGAEAFPVIEQAYPAIPILLTSGYSATHAFGFFPGKTFAGFLQKPFTASQLAGAVQEVQNRLATKLD